MGSDGKFISNLKPYADLLDYITIMAYDFYASSFSSSTGPNSPFNSCTSSGGSVKLAVSNWIDSGFPACKILLGIGTYSHVFKTSSNKLVKTFYKLVSLLHHLPLLSILLTFYILFVQQKFY